MSGMSIIDKLFKLNEVLREIEQLKVLLHSYPDSHNLRERLELAEEERHFILSYIKGNEYPNYIMKGVV